MINKPCLEDSLVKNVSYELKSNLSEYIKMKYSAELLEYKVYSMQSIDMETGECIFTDYWKKVVFTLNDKLHTVDSVAFLYDKVQAR